MCATSVEKEERVWYKPLLDCITRPGRSVSVITRPWFCIRFSYPRDHGDSKRSSYFNPILRTVGTPEIWPSLFMVLRQLNREERIQSLKDINYLLVQHPGAVQSLTNDPSWMLWVLELLADIPDSTAAPNRELHKLCIGIVCVAKHREFLDEEHFCARFVHTIEVVTKFGGINSMTRNLTYTIMTALFRLIGQMKKYMPSDYTASPYKNLLGLVMLTKRLVFRSFDWQDIHTYADQHHLDQDVWPLKLLSREGFVDDDHYIVHRPGDFFIKLDKCRNYGVHWEKGEPVAVALVERVIDTLDELGLSSLDDTVKRGTEDEEHFLKQMVNDAIFFEDTCVLLRRIDQAVPPSQVATILEKFLYTKTRSDRRPIFSELSKAVVKTESHASKVEYMKAKNIMKQIKNEVQALEEEEIRKAKDVIAGLQQEDERELENAKSMMRNVKLAASIEEQNRLHELNKYISSLKSEARIADLKDMKKVLAIKLDAADVSRTCFVLFLLFHSLVTLI